MLSPQAAAGGVQQPVSIPVSVMYYQPAPVVATAVEVVQYVPTTPVATGSGVTPTATATVKTTPTAPPVATAPVDSKSPPALPPPIKVTNKPLAETLLVGDGRDFWKANFNHSVRACLCESCLWLWTWSGGGGDREVVTDRGVSLVLWCAVDGNDHDADC